MLVADDNADNRRVISSLLGRHDVDATVVGGGHEALARLAAEPFDVLFLDGMMPGLDGPATAREIRRREAAAGVPRIAIVALTASSGPESSRGCWKRAWTTLSSSRSAPAPSSAPSTAGFPNPGAGRR